MDDLSEEEITKFVNNVLLEKEITNYLGLAENDILENIYNRFSKILIGTDLNEIFQDLKKDIVSRKTSLTLKELHTVTKNCKKCNISSSAELPKWNVENPDIVVVVESPNMTQESISLMVDSFKLAGIQSQQLCLTYVNRCPVPRKYEQQEVTNCFPYLHSEIQILNPKIILCLGALPSSILFGTPLKIKDIRGSIKWLGYWPTLTTYSPMYVAKSNELNNSNILEQFNQDISFVKSFIFKKSKND